MAARRGVWALARFLHRKQLPGEKEKNALAGCQFRLVAPKRRSPSAFRPLGKAFFPFSPALGTHGAQKRAKAHSPGLLQGHKRVPFIVSGFPACAFSAPTLHLVAQAFQPVPIPVAAVAP